VKCNHYRPVGPRNEVQVWQRPFLIDTRAVCVFGLSGDAAPTPAAAGADGERWPVGAHDGEYAFLSFHDNDRNRYVRQQSRAPRRKVQAFAVAPRRQVLVAWLAVFYLWMVSAQ